MKAKRIESNTRDNLGFRKGEISRLSLLNENSIWRQEKVFQGLFEKSKFRLLSQKEGLEFKNVFAGLSFL